MPVHKGAPAKHMRYHQEPKELSHMRQGASFPTEIPQTGGLTPRFPHWQHQPPQKKVPKELNLDMKSQSHLNDTFVMTQTGL